MAERESEKHRSRRRAALRVAGGSAAPAGPFTPIERAIDAVRAGRMIIVVDDEGPRKRRRPDDRGGEDHA